MCPFSGLGLGQGGMDVVHHLRVALFQASYLPIFLKCLLLAIAPLGAGLPSGSHPSFPSAPSTLSSSCLLYTLRLLSLIKY